jgi:hypothetical protein
MHHEGAPLLDAVELLVVAAVQAARLYPEWADGLLDERTEEMVPLAQRLVALTWPSRA